jgi:hypothetical protein
MVQIQPVGSGLGDQVGYSCGVLLRNAGGSFSTHASRGEARCSGITREPSLGQLNTNGNGSYYSRTLTPSSFGRLTLESRLGAWGRRDARMHASHGFTRSCFFLALLLQIYPLTLLAANSASEWFSPHCDGAAFFLIRVDGLLGIIPPIPRYRYITFEKPRHGAPPPASACRRLRLPDLVDQTQFQSPIWFDEVVVEQARVLLTLVPARLATISTSCSTNRISAGVAPSSACGYRKLRPI